MEELGGIFDVMVVVVGIKKKLGGGGRPPALPRPDISIFAKRVVVTLACSGFTLMCAPSHAEDELPCFSPPPKATRH